MLLQDDGILVIPTVTEFPFKRDSRKKITPDIEDHLHALLSIAGMSGCCQVLDCISFVVYSSSNKF